jgi:hypothetical protein
MGFIQWITTNWLAIVILAAIVALMIYDYFKEKRKTAEEKKKEALDKARRVADVKYVGDNKEFVIINTEYVEPTDFLVVYSNMEKEGYVYEQNINNFSPYDTIVFMRKKR